MSQQTISLGSAANDGTGDSLRVGGGKINDNFAEVYAAAFAADTGWTDNADGGSKSAVIPDEASIASTCATLELNFTGAGNLLLALAQKVKALETALRAKKYPGA